MSETLGGQGLITFRLPSSPPSMNSLYAINFRKREVFMKPEVRLFKNNMKLYVPNWDTKPTDKIEAEFEVVENWFFKNGNMKKADVQNVVKVLIDLIAEKIGFDDSQIWKFSANKKHSDTERCVNVILRKMPV